MKQFIICLISIILAFNLQAQNEAKISNIKQTYLDGKLRITYDLSAPSDTLRYMIWLEAKNDYGKQYEATAVSGDVGVNITPGKDKVITWFLLEDGIDAFENLEVLVNGEVYYGQPEKGMTLAKAMLLSTLVPGWGVSASGGNRANLFIGGVGYAFLISYLFTNSAADAAYENYLFENESIQDSNDYFDQAKKQRKIAKPFGIGAATVWGFSYIYTLIRAPKLMKRKNEKSAFVRNTDFQIISSYNHTLNAQTIGFVYRF